MSGLFTLNAVRDRIFRYFHNEAPITPRWKEPMSLLFWNLYQYGEISHSQAQSIMHVGETYSRRIIKEALERQFISSPSPKGKLSIEFPAATLDSYFPRLVLGV